MLIIAPNANLAQGHHRSLRENPRRNEHRPRLSRPLLCRRHRLALHTQDFIGISHPTQKLFKSENIQYKVYPVTRYTELFARIEESKVYEQVKLFFFINCGGILDLTQSDLLQRNDPTLLLFDVNKPIHHKNIESRNIKVIDDGCSGLDNFPTAEEIDKYAELNEYDLE